MKTFNRNILIAISILVGAYLIYTFRSIVSYILIAWVLSMLGQPLMRFFQRYIRIGKYKAGPNFSAALTLLSYFLVVALIGALFVPLFIEQAYNLSRVDYDSIARTMQQPIEHFQHWLTNKGIVDDGNAPEQWLRNTFNSSFDPTKIGKFISAVVSAASGLFVDISCIVFVSFFFLKEPGLFMSILTTLAPSKVEQQIHDAVKDISRLLTRYFGGILLQMSSITLYMWIFLSILGIQNALLIAFFAALMNIIPYVGPLIGGAFGILVTITSNVDMDFYSHLLPLIAKVALAFATMQMLDNYILQPRIFSKSVSAHPLEIFIVILMGAQVNGVSGMVLAIPVYTVLRVIAREFLYQYRIVQKLTENLEEEEPAASS